MCGGEAIEIDAPPPPEIAAELPEDIPLDVVFEDEHLLVINKPVGLVVHPGNGNWSGTLLNALLHRDPALAAVPRAGIVHRLDKDTSGLMVVARTLAAHTELVRQLQARSVRRHYWALVQGELGTGGTVDAPIGRHPTQRIKMAVVGNGRPALTHYLVVERFRAARSSSAGWRPGARTRSACIWRISGIRSSAMRSMVSAAPAMPRSMAFRARPCMLSGSDCCTRRRASRWNGPCRWLRTCGAAR